MTKRPNHVDQPQEPQPTEYVLSDVARRLHKSRSWVYKQKDRFLAGKPGGLPVFENENREYCVEATVLQDYMAELERIESHKPQDLLDQQDIKYNQMRFCARDTPSRHTSVE